MLGTLASSALASEGLSTALGNLGSIGSLVGSVGSLFGGDGKNMTAQDYANDAQLMTKKNVHGYWGATMAAAKQHGIHPLVALGVSPSTSSGGSVYGGASKDMGQNVSRAAKALQDIGDRKKQRVAEDLALEHARLENELLKSQITSVNKASNPAVGKGSDYLVDGQGNSNVQDDKVQVQPHKVISKSGKDKGLGAGMPPAFIKYDLGSGQTIELPFSEEGPSEAMESLPAPIEQLKALELYGKRYYNKIPPGTISKRMPKWMADMLRRYGKWLRDDSYRRRK
jgi:hypothetical protein